MFCGELQHTSGAECLLMASIDEWVFNSWATNVARTHFLQSFAETARHSKRLPILWLPQVAPLA